MAFARTPTQGLAEQCAFTSVTKFGDSDHHGTTLYAKSATGFGKLKKNVGALVRVFPGVRSGGDPKDGVYILVDNRPNGGDVDVQFARLPKSADKELRARIKQYKDLLVLYEKLSAALERRAEFTEYSSSEMKKMSDALVARIKAETDPKKRDELLSKLIELRNERRKAIKTNSKAFLELLEKYDKTVQYIRDANRALDEGIILKAQAGSLPVYDITLNYRFMSDGKIGVSSTVESRQGASTFTLQEREPVNDDASRAAIEKDLTPALKSFCENVVEKRADGIAYDKHMDKKTEEACEKSNKSLPRGRRQNCKQFITKETWGLADSREKLEQDLAGCSVFGSEEFKGLAKAEWFKVYNGNFQSCTSSKGAPAKKGRGKSKSKAVK